MPPDPKPPRRIRDKQLLAAMHLRWRECALAYTDAHDRDPERQLSLHHISKHPRHDTVENLVMLCGSGTTGCHGRVEAHDPETIRELNEYLANRFSVRSGG